MRTPFRVEFFPGLDQNEDSSRTFPSVLVPGLRDGVTPIRSSCVFLHTRSERRLVQYTYPRLLRDGDTLWVECGLSSHSIETKFSLDSWSVFLQDGVTLFGSGSRKLISSEGIPRVGLMGAFFPGCESRYPLVNRYALKSGCPAFRCLRFLRGLCLYPSSQQRSRSLTFCFYWPCRLSPSPDGSVCFGGLTVIPFTWAFMHWPYTHGGPSGSRPSQKGLLAYCQGASESLPHPSPGREVDASVFGIAVQTLLLATPLTRSHGILPYAGPGIVRLCL